ncbi:MAG: phytanoyl-CoA dioxygenase family protein [Pseudomonadota bacterium]
MTLRLESDGAERYPGFIEPEVMAQLEAHLTEATACAGIRIFNDPWLDDWLAQSSLTNLVVSLLDADARPVRAILFDKSEEANWAVGWHQDRTIAVRRRIDLPGFGRWTIKGGAQHVEPPSRVIERMVTARIHLDPVMPDNAPLLIASGSHRLGRIAETDIEEVIARCEKVACLAERGDVWLYRTAIVHASERSSSDSGRRVLQVDFSADGLPGGLEWLGIS